MEENIIKWFVENRSYPQSPFDAEEKARKFIKEVINAPEN